MEKNRTELGEYRGGGVFIQAGKWGGKMFKNMNPQHSADNMAFLKKYLPNMEIQVFDGFDHDDLYNDQSLSGRYTEILRRLAKEYQEQNKRID